MAKPTDIELTVGLSVEDIGNSTKTLQDMIKDIFDKSAGKDLDLSLQRIKQQMAAVTAEATRVIQKMVELENTQLPTAEYTAIEDHLHTVQESYDKLLRSQERLREQGITEGTVWDRVQVDLERFKSLIEEDEQRLQELVDTGKAFTLGSDTEEYKQLAEKLALINNRSRILINTWERNTMEPSVNKTVNGMNKLGQSAKKAASSVSSLKSASSSVGKSLSTLNTTVTRGIKSLLKYALGIGSIMALFNKLRSAATEGIKALVQWEGQNGKLNKSISDLKSAMSTLKSNIGAMVAPLINALAPAITKIINLISAAIQKISMFIALLSGQKTILVANEVQENYAASLDKTAKSAKKAEKALKGYLSPLDEINKYESNKDEDTSGGGGGGGAGAGFKEIPVDSDLLKWFEELKKKLQPIIDRLKELWGIFKDGFFAGLGDWQSKVSNIIENIKKIGQHLKDIFSDKGVTDAINGWMDSVARLLGTVAGAVASIGLTIAQNLVGGIEKYLADNKERIKQSITDIFNVWSDINNELSMFFEDFADTFSVFGDENGQQCTAELIGIFSDAFADITELTSKAMRDIIGLIVDPFHENKEQIKQTLDDTLGQMSVILHDVKQTIDDIGDTLNRVWDEHISPALEDIKAGLSEAVGIFLDFWNEDISPVLDELGVDLDDLWKNDLKPLFDDTMEIIGDLAEVIGWLFKTTIGPLLIYLKTVFGPTIRVGLEGILSSIKFATKVISMVLGTVTSALRALLTFFRTGFTKGWSEACNGLKNDFFKILDSMKQKTVGIINVIIDSINSLVRGAVSVGDGVMKLLNKIPGVNIPIVGENIPQIPHLAQGAVIPPNKQFLAMLGDQKQGTNIETPLSTMLEAFNQALAQNGGAGKTEINFLLPDRRKLAQYVLEGGRVIQTSTGNNPFQLA